MRVDQAEKSLSTWSLLIHIQPSLLTPGREGGTELRLKGRLSGVHAAMVTLRRRGAAAGLT